MRYSGIRIAVLRGGPSSHYEHSLKTGEHVLSALRELPDYYPIDIFISREGDWHRDGLVEEPHHALRHIDLIWNALHGTYGSDGEVQKILEGVKIPYTGASAVASILASNRDMARNLYRSHSMRVPTHEMLSEGDFDEAKIVEIFRNYMHPVVVRPASIHHSLGARVAQSFGELKDAVKETFRQSPRVIVEEGIEGDKVLCAVLEGAKNEKIYAFEPIKLPASAGGSSNEPSKKLTKPVLKTIEEMSKKAHEVLGLRHYSLSHFVVSPKGRVYILETEAHPAFHKDSNVQRTLERFGWRHHDFVNHVIKLSL